jgi:VWFA-related protein
MRRIAAGIIGTLAALSAAPLQVPVFRASTDTVLAYATVRGPDGRLLTDLTADDFQLFEDGRPVPIVAFSRGVQPITSAVVVDMGTVAGAPLLAEVRAGLLGLIDDMRPDDRIRIITFGSEISVSPILTGDKVVLSRIVREELWPQGPSLPWPAVNAALQSLSGEVGRRAVLLVGYHPRMDRPLSERVRGAPLSDLVGEFYLTAWTGRISDVRKKALSQDFLFYAVGTVPAAYGSGVSGLSQQGIDLANDTGGGFVVPANAASIAATLVEVADELRRQYVLGFVPIARDGKEHKIKVESRRGVAVRGRRAFIAPTR